MFSTNYACCALELKLILSPYYTAAGVAPSVSSGQHTEPSIRYLLLNPAIYFSRIVDQCRAVVIAGGTMQPVSEFTDQLLHVSNTGCDVINNSTNRQQQRILEFSCGESDNYLKLSASDCSYNYVTFTEALLRKRGLVTVPYLSITLGL